MQSIIKGALIGLLLILVLGLVGLFATLPKPSLTAPTSAHPTQTFSPKDYVGIDVRELVSYADNHVGEPVQISGKVFNIIDNQSFQMHVGKDDKPVVVQLKAPMSHVYEGDTVTVYGTVAGYATGKNSFGGEIKQPMLVEASLKQY